MKLRKGILTDTAKTPAAPFAGKAGASVLSGGISRSDAVLLCFDYEASPEAAASPAVSVTASFIS